jgi:hypothetical protein
MAELIKTKYWTFGQSSRFQTFAIGIAVALGRLHARDLIHHEVNPA